ncbi:MAG TPA: hypothetical protein VF077_01550 [Nitrospiraceae bacterium]
MANPNPKIHSFPHEGCAYDACQTDENIANGDLLVIGDNAVIGLAGTWPVLLYCADNGWGTKHEFHTADLQYKCELAVQYPRAFEVATQLFIERHKPVDVSVVIHECYEI